MERYAVTLVFEVGAGKMPQGADVLERMRLGTKAVHRFSYCDGRTLTVIVDWSAVSADRATSEAAVAIRLLWTQMTGADPGDPLTGRTRPLRGPRVPAGLRAAATGWSAAARRMHLGSRQDRLDVRDDPWTGPEGPDEPDDGGSAGVREPRRPSPAPPSLARALEEPPLLP